MAELEDQRLLVGQNGTFPDQRYLGTARNNAWLKNRTAALNLRNLIRRGLDRRNGAWTLA